MFYKDKRSMVKLNTKEFLVFSFMISGSVASISDSQFAKCLSAKSMPTLITTFYHLAKKYSQNTLPQDSQFGATRSERRTLPARSNKPLKP